MRIIGGNLKGREIKTPRGLPVRPTTSFATEGLFNILNNRINYEEVSALDLFSGTGHISVELVSRGCKQITAVDKSIACYKHLLQTATAFNIPLQAVKQDVFLFLKERKQPFDLIFADPPYDLPNMEELHRLVFENGLLNQGGVFILEHGSKKKFAHLSGFYQERKYGNVHFSFFEKNK